MLKSPTNHPKDIRKTLRWVIEHFYCISVHIDFFPSEKKWPTHHSQSGKHGRFGHVIEQEKYHMVATFYVILNLRDPYVLNFSPVQCPT